MRMTKNQLLIKIYLRYPFQIVVIGADECLYVVCGVHQRSVHLIDYILNLTVSGNAT